MIPGPEHWVVVAVIMALIGLHATAADDAFTSGDEPGDHVAVLASLLLV